MRQHLAHETEEEAGDPEQVLVVEELADEHAHDYSEARRPPRPA